MKQSNFKSIYFGAAVVILLNCASCGKYEDGPNFSLKSKTSRLVGEWEVVKMDNEPVDGEMIIEFEKDGGLNLAVSYTDPVFTFTLTGDWEFNDDKSTIEVTVLGDKQVWDVLRLTNSELWFEDEDIMKYECEKK